MKLSLKPLSQGISFVQFGLVYSLIGPICTLNIFLKQYILGPPVPGSQGPILYPERAHGASPWGPYRFISKNNNMFSIKNTYKYQ